MTVVQERVPGAPAVRIERPLALRVTAYVVLLGWAVIVTVTLLVGTRDSTYAELEDGLRSGRVTEVVVSGGLPPGASGGEAVHLTWRDRFGGHSTFVRETSRQHVDGVTHRGEFTAVVHRPVASELRRLQPAVRLRSGGSRVTDSATVLGWHAPVQVAYAYLGLWVASIGLVAVTAMPRRATSWAWAWFVLLLPVGGPVAFLLLSGVTRRHVPTPYRRPGLTGGWAFLLVLVLGSVLHSA